jgi:hypothetical protein
MVHPHRDTAAAVTDAAAAWIVPGSGAAPSCSVRPVTNTVNPAAPSASAMPLPAPRLAPVTTATGALSTMAFTPQTGSN